MVKRIVYLPLVGHNVENIINSLNRILKWRWSMSSPTIQKQVSLTVFTDEIPVNVFDKAQLNSGVLGRQMAFESRFDCFGGLLKYKLIHQCFC